MGPHVRKRTIPEMEYQLSALRWRLRARTLGLMIEMYIWFHLTVLFGMGMELPIVGAAIGATGIMGALLCAGKLLKERGEYICKVTEFNDMLERGNNA